MRKATGCRSCVNYCYCWERSRDYRCRSFQSMYKEVTEDKENNNVRNTADDRIFVDNDGCSSVRTDNFLMEVVPNG